MQSGITRRLQNLRLFCDAFHDLADDFDEEIEYLEAIMQPTVIARGIDHLPDDILADIIEFVEAPSNDLANGCHRFRRVMYYLPTSGLLFRPRSLRQRHQIKP